MTWLLPLVWLEQSFERCRHVALFVVVALVAIAAMWPHTRWATWLAKNRPDFYEPDAPPVARPWWASVWLPVLAVLISLALQVARVPVPVIGCGLGATFAEALAGRSARRAQGERAEAGRTEPPLQRLHRRRLRDLPHARLQGVRGRSVRGVRRAVADRVREGGPEGHRAGDGEMASRRTAGSTSR